MPQLGDIKRAKELGYKGNQKGKYMWVSCPDCKQERWVRVEYGVPRAIRCIKCNAKEYGRTHSGTNSVRWKGGRHVTPSGYIDVQLQKDDFFYSMVTAKKEGRIAEHRLVMAKSLGRCLATWEQVHHKNGDRGDNRIENLELTTQGAHHIAHSKGYKDGFSKGLLDGRNKQIQSLKNCITKLEAEIIRLG